MAAAWRPIRRRLRQRFGLGRYGRRGLQERLAAAERDIVALLARLYRDVGVQPPSPSTAGQPSAGARFQNHEIRLSSQNGEDGLLLHIFSQVGVTDRRLVEFGIEDGRECLARMLVLHFGWTGLVMDCDARNVADAERFYRVENGIGPDRLAIAQCMVTCANINQTLVAQGIEDDIDLLAIDIDGNDYWVWKAIEVIRPRVVVVEYNASLGKDEAWIVAYDPAFERKAAHPSGWYHSASLAAFADLGRRRGYALVGCDSGGINAFFVRRELLTGKLPEVTVAEAWRPHRSRGQRATPEEQLALLRTLPLVKDP